MEPVRFSARDTTPHLMNNPNDCRQTKLEKLRRDVLKGIDSGPSEDWNALAVKSGARARRAAMLAASSASRT